MKHEDTLMSPTALRVCAEGLSRLAFPQRIHRALRQWEACRALSRAGVRM